jgi:hypothetical protein
MPLCIRYLILLIQVSSTVAVVEYLLEINANEDDLTPLWREKLAYERILFFRITLSFPNLTNLYTIKSIDLQNYHPIIFDRRAHA